MKHTQPRPAGISRPHPTLESPWAEGRFGLCARLRLRLHDWTRWAWGHVTWSPLLHQQWLLQASPTPLSGIVHSFPYSPAPTLPPDRRRQLVQVALVGSAAAVAAAAAPPQAALAATFGGLQLGSGSKDSSKEEPAEPDAMASGSGDRKDGRLRSDNKVPEGGCTHLVVRESSECSGSIPAYFALLCLTCLGHLLYSV